MRLSRYFKTAATVLFSAISLNTNVFGADEQKPFGDVDFPFTTSVTPHLTLEEHAEPTQVLLVDSQSGATVAKDQRMQTATCFNSSCCCPSALSCVFFSTCKSFFWSITNSLTTHKLRENPFKRCAEDIKFNILELAVIDNNFSSTKNVSVQRNSTEKYSRCCRNAGTLKLVCKD